MSLHPTMAFWMAQSAAAARVETSIFLLVDVLNVMIGCLR